MHKELAYDISTGFKDLIPESIVSKWLSKLSNKGDLCEAYANFQFRLHNSSGASSPSTKILIRNLAGAVSEFSVGLPVLLLSSGKDSVALALAFSECGIQLDCVSLISDDEERDWIRSFCMKLGHRVEFIHHDEIKAWLTSNTIQLNSNYGICFDQALMFFIAASKILSLDSGITLIDGMGNDIYFGHIPSVNQVRAHYIGSYFPWPQVLRHRLGFFLRRPIQAHGMATASSYIFNSDYLQRINNKVEQLNSLTMRSMLEIIDFRAFLRGSLIDDYCYAEKTRILSKMIGCRVAFPWAESQMLTQYVFNLPKSEKFDEKKLVNKILLRKLLLEKLNYSRKKRGIDQLTKISTQEILGFADVRLVPPHIKEKVIGNRTIPLVAKKRALIEVAIFNSLLSGFGEDISNILC